MRSGWMLGAMIVLASFAAPPVFGQSAPGAAGHWLSEDKDGVIAIYDCADKLCGKLVWIRDPLDPSGKPLVDDKNPDPNLRTRPRCGMVMLGGFTPTGTQEWGDGWIYDPTSGKTYSAKMRLDGANLLKLRGFVGISLFGETQDWTRADPKLENCGP